MTRSSFGMLAVCGALASFPAFAVHPDLEVLREEVAKMRQHYEQRIAALEEKLSRAESHQKSHAEESAPQAHQDQADHDHADHDHTDHGHASDSMIQPSISLVLNGTLTRMSQDADRSVLGGFILATKDSEGPRRGFSLGESEIALSADVDKLFRGQLTLALPSEGAGAEVEQAYIQTLGIGKDVTVKAGRFLSGVGHLNAQHAHVWDFVDAPLMYKAMFGGALKNDGVQMKWRVPANGAIELGFEAARGGSFPSTDRNKNGPALGAAFLKASGESGRSNRWRAGLSFLGTTPRDREYADFDHNGNEVLNAFTGRSRTLIAEAAWKWAPENNPSSRSLLLQGEYFRRLEKGRLHSDVQGTWLSGDYRSRQSGYYAQTIYQFTPHWRVGYRHDHLDSGSPVLGLIQDGIGSSADFPLLKSYRPKRDSLMVDWSASAFSRLRLQLANDRSRPDIRDRQLGLQYIMNIGTHPAHSF